MSKPTPGPWEVGFVSVFSGPSLPHVQRGDSGGFVVKDNDPGRAFADAHLIAAAPDLLEVLEELFGKCMQDGSLGHQWVGMDRVERIEAAIRKAKGGKE